MDIIFACLKLGFVGFLVGHLLLLYAIFRFGRRRPALVRAVGRRVALFLLGPETRAESVTGSHVTPVDR